MNEWLDLIGWALLDFVWQGTLLGAACALLLRILHRAAAAVRYALACGALLLCLLLPLLNMLFAWQSLDSGAKYLTLAARVGRIFPQTPNWQQWFITLQPHLPALVLLWLMCVALLALRMAVALSWLGGYAGDKRSSAAPQWQQRFDALAAKLGISRRVVLRVVRDLESPVTLGSLRPLVLVPLALLSGMPAPLLEALLAHELAHIRRHDFLVNLLQSVIETLLFYHPVVWWLSKRIRIEREHIADDLAASVIGDPRRLALALSELAQIQSASSALVLAANGGMLLPRIKRLLRPDAKPLNWQASMAVAGIALACLSLCAQVFSGSAPALSAITAVITAPVVDIATCPSMSYPAQAAQKGESGTTVLAFLVSKDGRIMQSKVLKSSGSALLDQAAASQLGHCKAQAGSRNGHPLQSWLKLAYEWKLE